MLTFTGREIESKLKLDSKWVQRYFVVNKIKFLCKLFTRENWHLKSAKGIQPEIWKFDGDKDNLFSIPLAAVLVQCAVNVV